MATVGVHTRRVRLLFVAALVTFAFASMYSGTALLARVYPALFPGRTLPISIGVPVLGEIAPIAAPREGSVFTDPINLLIVGVDKRPWNDSTLTDTIMVATVDPLTGQASLLSFPRDMLIEIRPATGGAYEDRINTSYGVGVRNGKSAEAGARQLMADIKANFSIQITHWVVLDFAGAEKLIDAVGGVDMDIPYELSVGSWFYSDDDIHGRWISFPPGKQHLNGYEAVAFGRHREYDSDFQRVKRQQLVVRAALAQVFSGGLLNNPFELYDAYRDTVKTDVPRGLMPGYGLLLRETQGRLNTYSLGDPVDGVPTMIPYMTPAGAAVQKWVPENVSYWLGRTFTKSSYADSSVEIQNGYGEDGAVRASALGRYLHYLRELPAVYLGPDTTPQPTTTVTLFGDGKKAVAEDIAGWLGIPLTAIKMEPKSDPTRPDVIVVIGKDFRLPGG